jgi:hypothetical protein
MRIIEVSVTDLIDTLSGNSSVKTIQHATIEEAVFRVRGDVMQQWVVVTWHVFSVMHVCCVAI